MKMKILLSGLILLFLLVLFVFGERMIVWSFATWDYLHTEENCEMMELSSGEPIIESQMPVTMLIYEVKPNVVITDRGNMYPSDEYQAYGEGAWYGMATLLAVENIGATFLVDYQEQDLFQDQRPVRKQCKAFLPVGNYLE